nr:unnamed protein product [Callosobruchus chinensis]
MILDVAELIHCNEAMLEFELHSFRTQLMPQTYLKKNLLQKKADYLIKRLKATKEDEEITDKLVFEFKQFALETVVNVILFGVANDAEKPESKYHPLLLITKTQWLFLKLMFRLKEEKMSGILQLYLQKAENLLYSRCSQSKVEPVTRLYVAICKLKGDVNRVRKFCCEAFYYTEDLAVILMFTVLTSWVEIFPMQDDMKCYPIADVMVQLIYLKTNQKPQYKLHALKFLLNQYYGYPKERVNCDEFLKDLTQKYMSNPTNLSNFAIRLYCKYREANWLKEKINNILKPMVHQVPVGDNKFKATVITLLANICQHLHLGSRDKYMMELEEWFSSLSGANSPKVIKQSVQYALNMLQKKQAKYEIKAKRRTDLILRER